MRTPSLLAGEVTSKPLYPLSNFPAALHPTTKVIDHLVATDTTGPPYPVRCSVSEAWLAKIGTVAKSFSKTLQRPSLASESSTALTNSNTGDDVTTTRGGTTASAWRPASIWGSLWSGQTATASPVAEPTHAASLSAKKQGNDGSSSREDEDEEDEEGDGTLKGIEAALGALPSAFQAPPSRSDSSSAGFPHPTRLSSLFESWLGNECDSPSGSANPDDKEDKESKRRTRIVSEPMPIEDLKRIPMVGAVELGDDPATSSPGSFSFDVTRFQHDSAFVAADFEELMDALGIKDTQRGVMRQMDEGRKRFLIEQHHQQQQQRGSSLGEATSTNTLKQHKTGPAESSSISRHTTVSSTTSVFGTVSDVKRFSLASFGWASDQADDTPRLEKRDPLASSAASAGTTSTLLSPQATGSSGRSPAPLLQTATGWTSWFTSSSPTNSDTVALRHSATGSKGRAPAGEAKDTPQYYVTQITSGKIRNNNLVKLLIALRVRLATAQVAWIREFLDSKGLEALESVLKKATNKGARAN